MDDLWLCVFDFLPGPEIIACTQVSWSWRQLIHHYWRRYLARPFVLHYLSQSYPQHIQHNVALIFQGLFHPRLREATLLGGPLLCSYLEEFVPRRTANFREISENVLPLLRERLEKWRQKHGPLPAGESGSPMSGPQIEENLSYLIEILHGLPGIAGASARNSPFRG